jgi:serine/threonine-protein kinase RsbW
VDSELSGRRVTLVVPSDMLFVPEAGARIRRFCEEASLAGDDVAEIELCVVEAVNNAIEHAYGLRPGREVFVVAALGEAGLSIDISDEGRSIPHAVMLGPDPLAFDPADIDGLPERGMGLAIIRRVMDEVSYRTHQGRNTLSLVRRLPAPFFRARADESAG